MSRSRSTRQDLDDQDNKQGHARPRETRTHEPQFCFRTCLPFRCALRCAAWPRHFLRLTRNTSHLTRAAGRIEFISSSVGRHPSCWTWSSIGGEWPILVRLDGTSSPLLPRQLKTTTNHTTDTHGDARGLYEKSCCPPRSVRVCQSSASPHPPAVTNEAPLFRGKTTCFQ